MLWNDNMRYLYRTHNCFNRRYKIHTANFYKIVKRRCTADTS